LSKVVSDQADGLRRMMTRHPARLVAVIGSGTGVGTTSVVQNLAAALALQGKQVLVLDEHTGPHSICAQWQVAPAGCWADVATRRLPLDSAAGHAACGVQVLPAASGADAEVRALFQGQVALIDATLDANGALSPLAAQADDVLVVLNPQPASITAAYACIKRLHYAHALQQSRILLNFTGNAAEAQRVLANLSAATGRFLALGAASAGCVSADAGLPRAQQLHMSVVEAFPANPAAVSFRRIADDLTKWPWREQRDKMTSSSALVTAAHQSDRLLEHN
jgi:flagellar biosynthesis protein FlhG